MQEIKSLKNEMNKLKRSTEFTQNKLEERVHNVKENMFKENLAMPSNCSFESQSFNPFSINEYLQDNNQDTDVNF